MPAKKKILIVFGTRPEAIKMAPVVRAFRADRSFTTVVCVTSQHRHMLDQVLSLFDIRPDTDLNVMQHDQTLDGLTARALTAVSGALKEHKPDCVLVQGDTTTAMAVALAAFYLKIPVGHVEAGLRTHDRYNPFPEEINRRMITNLATFHFAPTKNAYQALLNEGKSRREVFLTGNTVVDALQAIRKERPRMPRGFSCAPGSRIILVTAHRRENFGRPLENICRALKTIVRNNPGVAVVYPVHLNPNVSGPVHRLLDGALGVQLLPPIEYAELAALLERCYLVLTDSGGIQEEAPVFGKPVLVMRGETERPEGISAGVARLVGTSTETIVRETERLLRSPRAYAAMSKAVSPYGDGRAARRIVSVIRKVL